MSNTINWDFKKISVLDIELYVVHETEFGETSQENIGRVISENVQTMAIAEGFGGRKLDSKDT